MSNKWYEKSYRRYILDTHIPDWKEDFLADFNPERYIELIKQAKVDTAIICSTSCLGYAYWPTKVGYKHRGIGNKDLVGTLTKLCRKEGIIPIIDINFWSTAAAKDHPEWNCITSEGKPAIDIMYNAPGRFGVCCLNSGYGEYFLELVKELAAGYDFDGLWVDMILWHNFCTCESCKKRYRKETGKEIPTVINWDGHEWVDYIHTRERWMSEYFSKVVAAAKNIKPDITVICNGTFYCDSLYGAAEDYYRMSEFIAGDFPTDRAGHSLKCRLFNSLAKNRPFECLVPVMDPELSEHNIMKSAERMETELFACIMNNGRYGFIDAINPSGTMNKKVYERMNKLYTLEEKYEKYLTSNVDFCADVAIYTNCRSDINPEDNGKKSSEKMGTAPHVKALYGATLNLIERHIPFAVITKYDLDSLSKYKTVILPDLYAVSHDETEAFTEYVKNGGCLYISGLSGLYDGEGNRYAGGALSHLIGGVYTGVTEEKTTYIRPEGEPLGILTEYTGEQPLTLNNPQVIVKENGNAQVLARMTLPLYDKTDNSVFSSAISDPPQIDTDYPSILLNRCGNGKVIYVSGAVEKYNDRDRAQLFSDLLVHITKGELSMYTNAPSCVEITAYQQKENRRYIVNFLNRQESFSNLPVYDIDFKLYIGEYENVRVLHIPDNKEVKFDYENGFAKFTLNKLEIFDMYIIEY